MGGTGKQAGLSISVMDPPCVEMMGISNQINTLTCVIQLPHMKYIANLLLFIQFRCIHVTLPISSTHKTKNYFKNFYPLKFSETIASLGGGDSRKVKYN